MSRERPLRGACSCGRNRYTVEVPEHTNEVAQVLFESGGELSRHEAAPLTAFLRIPLTWYRSTTYSFFPDESHSTIRRSYSSPGYPHAKRYFCGYCGTPLSYWTEKPSSEAEFISLALGSLVGDDLRELEDLGLIPPEVGHNAQIEKQEVMNVVTGGGAGGSGGSQQQQQPETRNPGHENSGLMPSGDTGNGFSAGVPWFETMMEGSLLGQLTRNRRVSRAKTTREVGGVKVEWEIIEWTNDTASEDTAGGGISGGGITSIADPGPARGNAGATTTGDTGIAASEGRTGDTVEIGASESNVENGSAKRKIADMEGELPTRRQQQQPTVEEEGWDVAMKG